MSVTVIGSVNLDISRRVARLPRWGETVMALGSERHAGGKGLNQAIAAARAGSAVGLIAAVGDDEPGRWLSGELAAAGVDLAQVVTVPAPTGDAQILVAQDGENLIVVTPGANALLSPSHARTGVAGEVFLAQLEVDVAAVEALFATPAARAGLKILNAAPADLRAARLLPLCDILVVNETELAAFAGLAEPPEGVEAAAAAARGLLGSEGQTVVVTLGKAGAVAVSRAGVTVVAGRPARAIDATGAGDCFCGALASALDQGMPMDRALGFANVAASLSVERRGAAPSMPVRAEILRALG